MQSWALLFVAIILEVMGTTAMKLSQGLTRPVPTLALVVFYAASFVLLALVLKRIEVSVAYAVWSGMGVALIAIIGVVVFKESLTLVKVLSLGLIIVGVVGLNLSGRGH